MVVGAPVVTPAYPVYSAPAYDSYAYGSYSDPTYNDPNYGNDYYDNSGYIDYQYDSNYNNYAAYAPYAPPPPRYEAIGVAPSPGFVWVSGYWNWGGRAYGWVPGQWMRRPYASARWAPYRYVRGPRGFALRAGFWIR